MEACMRRSQGKSQPKLAVAGQRKNLAGPEIDRIIAAHPDEHEPPETDDRKCHAPTINGNTQRRRESVLGTSA